MFCLMRIMIECFRGWLVVIPTVLLGPAHHDVYSRMPLMKFLFGSLYEDGDCSGICSSVVVVDELFDKSLLQNVSCSVYGFFCSTGFCDDMQARVVGMQ